MSIIDAFDHLLHHTRGSWSPLVSTDPFGCWACIPQAPIGPMCAGCQLRASARAADEGAAIFNRLDHGSTRTSHRWGPLTWN